MVLVGLPSARSPMAMNTTASTVGNPSPACQACAWTTKPGAPGLWPSFVN
jgi:hypothetical protein